MASLRASSTTFVLKASSRTRRERLVVVRSRTADLEILGDWLAQGELVTVVDRRLPLASFREAFERLESKRTRGKIVIEVSPN